MTMLKVSEIKRNKLNSYIDCLNDYDNGYICDIISEIADSHTSIYYSDIIEFISNNVEEVTDFINEFGWDGCGRDLYKAGQLAEYRKNENGMYSELLEGIENFALSYLEHGLKIQEIAEERFEEIKEFLSDVDSNDRLEEITDFLDEMFSDEDEE